MKRCDHGQNEETCEICLAEDLLDAQRPILTNKETLRLLGEELAKLERTDPVLREIVSRNELDRWREDLRARLKAHRDDPPGPCDPT